jgi:hypothetical protein
MFQFVWEWKAIVNINFVSIFLRRIFLNALMNFGSQSNTINFNKPWYLHHTLTKNYVVSNTVTFPKIGTMCANLANRPTITNMTYCFFYSNKFVMKTMHILCHDPDKIGNDCKRSPCFW